MKTHEIANALTALASILRRGPNQALEEWSAGSRRPQSSANIATALSTLVALSMIDKNEWTKLIQEHRFPIEVRRRDASRDVLGKLLRFLESNAEARERLATTATRGQTNTSPELMRALQLLLQS